MKYIALAAAAAIALTLASTANAGTIGRVTDSARGIPTPPPLPSPMPDIHHADCPGSTDIAGCYIGAGEADHAGNVHARGAVFVAVPGRFARLHELGHAFDDTMLDAGEREAFSRVLHLRDLLWTWSYEEDGLLIQDPGTLAEKFADAYATCRLGMRVGSGELWETGYGYYPTQQQHARVCRLITDAARSPGTPVAADGSR